MTHDNTLSVGEVRMAPAFPVGYHRLHEDAGLNFQLNRFFGGMGEEVLREVRAAAPRIRDHRDWKRELLSLAEGALTGGRRLDAAYYFRAAEFYMMPDDPDKLPARERFVALARSSYGVGAAETVPYDGGSLPAHRFVPENPKGTVVLFGGFDSYAEELFPMAFFLVASGYQVVVFEGPGQGGALEESRLPMTPEWERPVGAVLDHFGLDEVTLVGLSLGGGLAIRAAAFDRRVRRVVAWDILLDFLECNLRQTNPIVRVALRSLLAVHAADTVNDLARRTISKSLMLQWGLRHGMNVFGVESPYEYLRELDRYNTARVSRHVECDVLLLAGADDHYVPLSQFYRQIRALTGAGSVTGRIFTRTEQAQNHCQVGNTGLALDVVVGWMDGLGRRDGSWAPAEPRPNGARARRQG
ncbi:alpha/beta fold hydrolase [Rubrobacter tropicus]|uniref:Alpha/beta fold hydrolase n=1 Tax=Rubrobacter tropicus TaxID=2653851 RepID=A0A6G8QDI9_9ACTN|nr:alpha/beta fold hydrolase [Rubrobacter tropicus]QIN84461.1 alpha/beta fold hydrolase [Rubrobacter tropicus]